MMQTDSSQNSPFISTPAIERTLRALKSGTDHLFITGKAGTGKSTLLTTYRQSIEQLGQELVVLAPTGVAALNVNGQTIHSFFGIAPNASLEETKRTAQRSRKKELFRTLTEIVIDEISMVRSDLLDCVDVFLRTVRQSPLPFGGVRMIFFGDLYQLPPVVTRYEETEFYHHYDTAYFFGATVIRSILEEQLFGGLQVIELDEVFRQQDGVFIDLLNAIRTQTVTEVQLERLNQQVGFSLESENPIILTGRRDSAQRINQQHLRAITQSTHAYSAEVTGSFPKGYEPTETKLELKVGARVMFVANDSNKRWVNGSLGTILHCGKTTIQVRLDDGEIEQVSPYTWEISRMVFSATHQQLERETLGSFKQLPVMIAHAITIHKSQGKTFDSAIIDVQGSFFAPGQTYVALSRNRSLDGISLTQPIQLNHIKIDRTINQFYQDIQHLLIE